MTVQEIARAAQHRARRYCEHCGGAIPHRVLWSPSGRRGALEPPSEYGRRRFCGRACANRHRAEEPA